MVAQRIKKWLIIVMCIIAATLAVRVWWLEVFRVPTESMLPTLSVGDLLLVNKIAFGPPWKNDKDLPKRGDVVVFPHPQTHTLYVKRVIAFPGDEVMVLGEKIWVNGVPFDTIENTMQFNSPSLEGKTTKTEQRLLSNGRTYRTVSSEDGMTGWRMSGYWVVPPQQIFVMGDARDHSSDSREWGSVPIKSVIGKVLCSWGDGFKGCNF